MKATTSAHPESSSETWKTSDISDPRGGQVEVFQVPPNASSGVQSPSPSPSLSWAPRSWRFKGSPRYDVVTSNSRGTSAVGAGAGPGVDIDPAESHAGTAYYTRLATSWQSDLTAFSGCRVLARGIEADRPSRKEPLIKVGYLVVDVPDVTDMDKAYWINTVHLKPQPDYKGLAGATLLDDTIGPEAENLFYAALLVCGSRRLRIRNSKSHVTYLRIDGLDVSRHHLTFVKRLRCCFESDEPNSDATRDLQLAKFPIGKGSRLGTASSYTSMSGVTTDDDPYDVSKGGRETTDIQHVPILRSITGWALVHDSTQCWYLRNGQWVSDAFDLADVGPFGRRVDELESEAFALTALHVRALDAYWPVKDPVVAAVFVREEHNASTQTELIRALEFRLKKQELLSHPQSTTKRRATGSLRPGRGRKGKRKPNRERNPVESVQRHEKVNALGAPRSPTATTSDVEGC